MSSPLWPANWRLIPLGDPPTPEAVSGETLLAGRSHGPVLHLSEPLNVWGGLNAATGEIIHAQHPQRGASIAGTVLVLLETRGSGSNAQVLAEAWRNGKGPAAVVLGLRDSILVTGAVVADELYGQCCPVVLVGTDQMSVIGLWKDAHVAADEAGASVAPSASTSLTNGDG